LGRHTEFRINGTLGKFIRVSSPPIQVLFTIAHPSQIRPELPSALIFDCRLSPHPSGGGKAKVETNDI
jgi:hypothetical protein